MTKSLLTIAFFICLFAPQQSEAAVFYVDFQCGVNTDTTCGAVGTASATPFSSLDQFAEVARSAGDIAVVRRNQASTTNVSDLTFTSDGTLLAPIIITADYDNVWGDFSDSAQTYTVSMGTTSLYSSASTTGIVAGDWIYVAGDCTETLPVTQLNQCEYAYEVRSLTSTAITLYLPYAGNQSGSGLTIRKMGKNPIWNTAAGDFQFDVNTDLNWLIKGMHIRGTDANGQIGMTSSNGLAVFDTILEGNGANDLAIRCLANTCIPYFKKVRVANNNSGLFNCTGTTSNFGKDSFFESIWQNTGTSNAFNLGSCLSSKVTLKDSFFFTSGSMQVSGSTNSSEIILRNVYHHPGDIFGMTNQTSDSIYFEDSDNIIGKNFIYSEISQVDDTEILIATSTSVRPGGGATSIVVRPSTSVNSTWAFGTIKLFEYPIYTDGSSKQYDIYFKTATTTSAWTTDPLASELWIECDYWVHQTGATSTRKVTKSTGTIDFNGSASWQNLSVTCDPTQAGTLYLRGYYGKTKESGKSNRFVVDGTPVIN
jgi:hypothetical protein